MKTWPQFWQNQYCNKFGMTLLGSCLSFSLFAQTTPLATPPKTDYPGILETFEKLITIDQAKLNSKTENLKKSGGTLQNIKDISQIELDSDFLNSVILHSEASYIKLASSNKCMFYHSIINDLLKSSQGKLENIVITYLNSRQEKDTALVNRKDFLNKLAYEECPETPKLIDQFQVKNFDKTIKETNFTMPTGMDQCRNTYLEWLKNPKSPYFCKVHEYIKEADKNQGDPKDLVQRKAVAKILTGKLKNGKLDFIQNFCENIADEKLFCGHFLNTSFWTKISQQQASSIYVKDICASLYKNPSLSEIQLTECLSRLRRDNDLCMYPKGKNNGLIPQPECDLLSTALMHSAMKSDYQDGPANSDQLAITQMSRLLTNITKQAPEVTQGPLSAASTKAVLDFNKMFNNEERWKLEACYYDRNYKRENCLKTFFGDFATHPMSYTNVVATIIKKNQGAEPSLKCEMVDSNVYNPTLLKYKSGCFIIYETNKCFISECSHKILYNDKAIDGIKIKNQGTLDLYPINVQEERFSQHYLITTDYKQKSRLLTNLTQIENYYKRSKSRIMEGTGCAEYLLPSFFKMTSMNQCTPMPFIIDGLIKDGDKVSFVMRSAADSLLAPRIISWSNLFTAVKAYQKNHPLRHWTLYGLD